MRCFVLGTVLLGALAPGRVHADGPEATATSAAASTGDGPAERAEGAAPPEAEGALRLAYVPGPPALALAPLSPAPASEGADVWVRARSHDAPLFSGRQTRYGRGTVRRGTVLPAERLGRDAACDGQWLCVAGARSEAGYVCTGWGFSAFDDRPAPLPAPRAAALDAVMPYRYAAVVDRSAYRFTALPSRVQRERLAGGSSLPGLATPLNGDYFLALDGEVEHDGVRYVRTVRGELVEARFVEPAEPTELHGAYAPGGLPLPLAFVYTDDARLFARSGAEALPVGTAAKYARAPVRDEEGAFVGVTLPGTRGAFALRAEDVRVARRRARPRGVPASARWVHVDLEAQVLVAYEGDTPVFATLVASGREGYETPAGLYRVQHAYLSTSMRGEDPVDGPYDVAEVPWTMYYHRSFALHGAYWHDGFGVVRSHGCTNLAPVDARFLFRWGEPSLPAGWHGVRAEGFWVYNTD
ncbi:MAG: L,D-transpeptidase [Myxococcota bacterium]